MQEDESAGSAAETQERSGLCLLVVEDDEADAYLIRNALMAHPSVSRVVRASDGAEAWRMVEEGQIVPDLAFIDLHMPRKSGFDLLIDFACQPDVKFPLVVLTSSTAPSDAIRSKLRGAMRVIAKPDTVAEMEETLAAVVDTVRREPAKAC